jgi:hypothetical protein
VDHVYVPMTDAAGAFEVLTAGLGLPVLWPLTSFGSFSSGGMSLGSIKLEVIESNDVTPWSLAQVPAEIQGIAFRPSGSVDDTYLAELDRRGIPHTAPETFERDGRPGWTNVYVTDLVSDRAGGFVCDYHLPESKDVERRRRLLADCSGGRLGVLDAAQLVIASPNPQAAGQRWQRLLGAPERGDDLRWRLPPGPTLRVVEGDVECVDHLDLAVRSADEASRVWHEVGEPGVGPFPLRFVRGAGSA